MHILPYGVLAEIPACLFSMSGMGLIPIPFCDRNYDFELAS